jgi:hypothetical protein
MNFKIFSQKNLVKILAFFTITIANYLQKSDHNIGFWEKRHIFGENWQKSQKLVIITSSPGCTWHVCKFQGHYFTDGYIITHSFAAYFYRRSFFYICTERKSWWRGVLSFSGSEDQSSNPDRVFREFIVILLDVCTTYIHCNNWVICKGTDLKNI